MKSKSKNILFILLIVMLIGTMSILTACSNNENNTNTNKNTITDNNNTEQETTTSEYVDIFERSRQYSCEKFSTLCPAYWMNDPVFDIYSDTENVLAKNALKFIKTDSIENANNAISIKVELLDPEDDFSDYKSIYNDVTDIVFFDANNNYWTGFKGTFGSYKDMWLFMSDSEHKWQILCEYEKNGESIDETDVDLLNIINNLTVKETETTSDSVS